MRLSFRNLDAHQRLLIAVFAALIAFLVTSGHFRLSLQTILTWNAFAWCFILFSWIRIAFADARTPDFGIAIIGVVEQHAHEQPVGEGAQRTRAEHGCDQHPGHVAPPI